MHPFVQYWRIMDLDTKIKNVRQIRLNLTLTFELDLTIFVQILKVSPQFSV